MLEWREQHLMSERTEWMLLAWEHKIHIFELAWNVFADFRKISKDFRRFSKIVLKARLMFPKFSKNFRKFPKIVEDFWGTPEDVSMMHQRI